jgi:C4-dicarboxylate transporter, DctM subunit
MITAGLAGSVLFVLLAVFLLLGMSIAVSVGVASTLVIYFFTNMDMTIIPTKMYYYLDSFTLMAIPFFVFSGYLFSTGGVAKRLIQLTQSIVGFLPGGLALAGIFACGIFAAISGSSPATVLAVGGILIPAMIQKKYPKEFSVGTVTTAGSLGILIPPSIPMIVYCVVTENSTGAMFMAGVVPGVLLTFILMAIALLIAKKRKIAAEPFPGMNAYLKGIAEAVWDAKWSLLLPIIIIGGIYGGIFTPTEAAAIAVIFAFLVGMFLHKELRLKDMPSIIMDSAKTTSMLFLIISFAMVFAYVLTYFQIPQMVTKSIISMHVAPWLFLLIVNILLFFAGDFMEPTAIITILGPILVPVAVSLGIDPIHFGIMLIINMELGMITPPIGLNLYVASGLTGMSLIEVMKSCFPWMIVIGVFLMFITYIPQLSLWLPKLLGLM